MIADGGAILCINDHAIDLERAKRCKLARFFGGHGALYDAAEWERQGFLVADCKFDRADGEKLQQYVEQKYELGKDNFH